MKKRVQRDCRPGSEQGWDCLIRRLALQAWHNQYLMLRNADQFANKVSQFNPKTGCVVISFRVWAGKCFKYYCKPP